MRTAKPATTPLIFTTYDIGRMTGTDPTTVHKWIDKGLLRGYRTPGGHRRVRGEDLRAFLTAHGMPLPKELGGAESLRVLVLDEDSEALKATARQLKKLNPSWDLVTADSGVEGLLEVATRVPDVLVMDLGLEEVDPMAVCRQLHSRQGTAAIKMVATGNRLTAEQERRALSCGMAACVKKPLSGTELSEAIERAAGLATDAD